MASAYVVERSISIDASPEEVFERVSNLRRWSEWSPWEELDPNMDKVYSGTDGTVGSGYSWKGNRKAGAGEMSISDLAQSEQVTIDLRFLKPFKSANVTGLVLRPEADGTNVIWTMTGNYTLMSKIMGVFVSMDKIVGKDFERGLAKLKSVSES